MENTDLKWIKRHYGERFSHLCRDLFPTILETEGLLPKLISAHFPPNRELYNDLIENDLSDDFKNYIYSLIDVEKEIPEIIEQSPEKLLDKAGYILYPECKTEEDIQSFRHYYNRGEPTPIYEGGQPEHWEGEELCTFNGGRLDSCRIWFAVKKNVVQIKRENFTDPKRQDEYGTSVLSIQFTKSEPSTLSIKNRYNHTVNQPDATFGNDLDNITPGLTQAFINKYNIKLIDDKATKLELPSYVQANDGKFYRYNLETNGLYYCPNNIIIDFDGVNIYDKSKFVVFDNFILNVEKKKNISTDKNNAFIESIGKIKDIKRISSEKVLTIQITPTDGELVEIKLNKNNEIVGYSNPNVKIIGDNFLNHNKKLIELSLPKLEQVGNNFLSMNTALSSINAPNLKDIGDDFLYKNENLTNLNLPNLKNVGENFLYYNKNLSTLSLPCLENINSNFLYYNRNLSHINLPNLKNANNGFLYYNKNLAELSLPKLEQIGSEFLYYNEILSALEIPSVKTIKNDFLHNNKNIKTLSLPNVESIGNKFLHNNEDLSFIALPNLKKIENNFLDVNKKLTSITIPKLESVGHHFISRNSEISNISFPNLKTVDSGFLNDNNKLAILDLPNLQNVDEGFLYHNKDLAYVSLPNLKSVGSYFLKHNNKLSTLDLPNLKTAGSEFLFSNKILSSLNLPNLQNVGSNFMYENQSLTSLSLPKLTDYEHDFLKSNKNLTNINIPNNKKLKNELEEQCNLFIERQ